MFKRAIASLFCILFSSFHIHSVEAQLSAKMIPIHTYVTEHYKISLPVFWGPISPQAIKNFALEYGHTNSDGTVSLRTAEATGWSTTNDAGENRLGSCIVYRLKWKKSEARFIKLLIKDLERKSPGYFKLVKKRSTRIEDGRAKWFICIQLLNGKKVKQLNYILSSGKHLYYINYATTPEAFPFMEKVFRASIKTFEIR